MSFLARIFGGKKQREPLKPLYDGIVAAARDPWWYREGRVPDTLDGRFDMVSAMFALLLLRLEAEGEACRSQSVLLTEIFVDDMDNTLRQIGIGDYVVGKHIGRLMGALGGRLSAFRQAIAAGEGLEAPVRRNLFRDDPSAGEAPARVAARMEAFRHALGTTPVADLIAGRVPRP